MNRGKLPTLGAALALALLLAACPEVEDETADEPTPTTPTPEAEETDRDDDPADAVSQAARSSLDAGTAHVTVRIGEDGEAPDADATTDGTTTDAGTDDADNGDTGTEADQPDGFDTEDATEGPAHSVELEGHGDFDADQRYLAVGEADREAINGDTDNGVHDDSDDNAFGDADGNATDDTRSDARDPDGVEIVVDGTEVYVSAGTGPGDIGTDNDATGEGATDDTGDNGVFDHEGTNGTTGDGAADDATDEPTDRAGQHRWHRADLSDIDEDASSDPVLTLLRGSALALELLAEGAVEATSASGEDDSATGTSYEATVDVEDATGWLDDVDAAWLGAQADDGQLTMTVWVDDEHVTQVRYEGGADSDAQDADAAPTPEPGQASGSAPVTITYDDLGSDVTIEVPEADAVDDFDFREVRQLIASLLGLDGDHQADDDLRGEDDDAFDDNAFDDDDAGATTG